MFVTSCSVKLNQIGRYKRSKPHFAATLKLNKALLSEGARRSALIRSSGSCAKNVHNHSRTFRRSRPKQCANHFLTSKHVPATNYTQFSSLLYHSIVQKWPGTDGGGFLWKMRKHCSRFFAVRDKLPRLKGRLICLTSNCLPENNTTSR
jgi:hypothetical protein